MRLRTMSSGYLLEGAGAREGEGEGAGERAGEGEGEGEGEAEAEGAGEGEKHEREKKQVLFREGITPRVCPCCVLAARKKCSE